MASNQPNETDNNTTTAEDEDNKVVAAEDETTEEVSNDTGQPKQQKQQTKTPTNERNKLRRKPSILITGFGPFQDIPINPTTIIVNEICDYLLTSKESWKQNLVSHIHDCIVFSEILLLIW